MRSFLPFTLRRLEIRNSTILEYMSRSRRWRKNTTARKENRALATKAYQAKMEGEKEDYRAWDREKLIERVTQLENELKLKNLRYVLHLYVMSGELYADNTPASPHHQPPRRNPPKNPAQNEPSIPRNTTRASSHSSSPISGNGTTASNARRVSRNYQPLKKSYGKLSTRED